MPSEDLIVSFARVTVFLLMFLNGVKIPLSAFSLQSRWVLLARGALATVVLVPLSVMVLLGCVDLPVNVATGLALLAATPGAPLTTQRSRLAAGSSSLAASLQLYLALSAIVVTPLTLMLFKTLVPLHPELATPTYLVPREILVVSLLPLSLGLCVQRLLPALAEMIATALDRLTQILFLIMGVMFLWLGFGMTAHLGPEVIAVIVIMASMAVALGHLMGRGATLRERASLATASVARNLGLAFVIASADGLLPELLPTLIAYMLLGMMVAVPYAIWVRRRLP